MTFYAGDGREKMLSGVMWTAEDRPKCDDSKIFIADAIDRAGAALFGVDWSGRETFAPATLRHPDEVFYAAIRRKRVAEAAGRVPDGSQKKLKSLKEILDEKAQSIGEDTPSDTPPNRPAHLPNSQELEEHSRARPHLLQAWEDEKIVRERLVKTLEWVADNLRNARITGYRRPRSGGTPIAVEAAFWFRDDVRRIFSAGAVATDWIFLDRAELETQLLIGAAPPKVGTDLSPFSPVLQFIAWFAQTKAIMSPDDHYKEEAMRADIRDEWSKRFGNPPSVTQETAVYTGVRFPNFKAVEQGSLGGRRKRG